MSKADLSRTPLPLSAPQAQLAAILEATDEAIVTTDLDGTITGWNAAAERVFGYPAPDIIGQRRAAILPLDRLEEDQRILNRVRTGARIELNTLRMRKDGTEVRATGSISPVVHGDGTIVGILEILRDVTMRRRRAAHDRFLASVWEELAAPFDCELALARVARRAVPEQADWCSLHVADSPTIGRLVEVASTTARGDATEQIQLNHPVRFVRTHAPKVLLIPDLCRSQVVRHSPIGRTDIEVLQRVGCRSLIIAPICVHERLFAVLTFAYAEHSGRRYGVDDVGWALNVACRARLAIERTILRNELETARMANEDFLSILSFELRNPLNSVANALRLLQSAVSDEGLHARTAASLERNVSLLRRLIDNLIDASRAATGTLRLQLARVAGSTVVQDVVSGARPMASAKDISLQCMIDANASWVFADRNRLHQVLWHLLSNAIKFTSPGGRIDVRVERTASHLEMIVADSGVGLPSELLPHIFEPFWQEDPRFSRTHGGLGLGLALVRRIVEQHGGTVRAASAGSGEGATFTVALPLGLTSPVEEPPANGHGLIARLEGLRVLLVVDDEHWTQPAVDLLTLAGAFVSVERSAQQALKRLAAEHSHVLLIDADLSAIEGHDLLDELKRVGRTCGRSVRAAALASRRVGDAGRAQSLAAGYQMFLTRSIAAEDLLDAVIRLAMMGVDTPPS